MWGERGKRVWRPGVRGKQLRRREGKKESGKRSEERGVRRGKNVGSRHVKA